MHGDLLFIASSEGCADAAEPPETCVIPQASTAASESAEEQLDAQGHASARTATNHLAVPNYVPPDRWVQSADFLDSQQRVTITLSTGAEY